MSETTHRLILEAMAEVRNWERTGFNYSDAKTRVHTLHHWLDEGPDPVDERAAASLESLCQRLGWWP